MKKSYLFCTGILSYLCEIPLIILLIAAIYFNNGVDGILKLYPLIITTAAAIVFIFVFFFRMIVVSSEEVTIIGKFTSQACAAVKKDRTLTLTHYEPRRLRVELFDDGKDAPELQFLKNDPTYKSQGLNLFRETARCGEGALFRVLESLGVSKDDISSIKKSDTYKAKYHSFNLSSERTEQTLTVSLEFTKTV